ncbi:MAG: F0F1 ATP synthase subunit A [Halobacteriovoraceae bacterium]|nr:F0F1 ATP synthase subunit A [Halobacteriovoraceae bacterium]
MSRQLLKTLSYTFLFASISTNLLANSESFTWLGGLTHTLHLPWQVVHFAFVALLLIFGSIIYRATLSSTSNAIVPDKGITYRNIVELYGQFIYNQCKAVLGEKDAPKYYKFVATIFLVIFSSNVIGLIPGFVPPTENLSTTLALGLFSFLYYNFKGCKELGVINYIKHFAGPLWYLAVLIFPIEILSNIIRPVSLALRLKGNMMGDHKVLEVFSGLAPLFIPIVFMALGLLVCFIQAYVFTMLSMVYISLATAHHDHDEHHAH